VGIVTRREDQLHARVSLGVLISGPSSPPPDSRMRQTPEEESVKDSQGSLVQGRTRWRKFAIVLVPALAAVGGLLWGISAGAFPAQFTISGQQFKVSADELRGEDFRQVPGWDREADGTNHPVARSIIGEAELDNLCQSVDVPVIPALFPNLDKIVLRIEAGQGDPATASDLVIGVTELGGDATFTNIEIGNDAGDISGEPLLTGQFGQRSDEVVITDLRQTAYSTTAGTFRLTGLHLEVLLDSDTAFGGECFGEVVE
jgi:uncharacterized protein DUF6230